MDISDRSLVTSWRVVGCAEASDQRARADRRVGWRPCRPLISVSVLVAVAMLFGCQGCMPSGAGSFPSPVNPPTTNARLKSDSAPPVTLTPKAVERIRQIAARLLHKGNWYLRFRVMPGSCKGYAYDLNFDSSVSKGDYVWETAGIRMVILKRQVEMLQGTLIDFGEEGGEQGFKIESPNFTGEATKKWLDVLAREEGIN